MSADPDAAIRIAAFRRLRQLTAIHGGRIPWATSKDGFTAGGRHYLFASAAEGIFKPRETSGILSFKTVVPRADGRVRYHGQQAGDDPVKSTADLLPYAFSRTDPADHRNQYLREAMRRGLRSSI